MNLKNEQMKTLHKLFTVAIILVVGFTNSYAQDKQPEQPYDLVILNGRVIDPESLLDGVKNIGITDGKIIVVTDKDIKGKESIDATDLVVAPGFIDMHNHNTAAPFGQKLALRDGVTTPLEIEAGVYPVDKWYAALEGKSQSNFGASVGTIPVRENLFNDNYTSEFAGDFLFDMQDPDHTHTSMQWSTKVASQEEIEKVSIMLEKGLKQGALGIGHCPGYMEFGSTQRESNEAMRLAGKYGRYVAIHGRFSSQQPPTSGILGIHELMAPQAAYGGGLLVQHMTAQTLSVTPQALTLIDDARAQGVHVLAEIYPYDFGSTIAGADYLHPDNYQNNMGRDYKDIIEVSNMKPLTKERYEELVKTAPGTSVIFYNATEDMVLFAINHPSTIIGSDSYPYTLRKTGGPAIAWDTPFDGVNGHPRGAGTHARVLRWVREGKLKMSLNLAVSKMSYMIAKFMEDNGIDQMANKGRIQEGKDADITIFDPATVADQSTMKDGGLPSKGIPYVIVNGTIVVKNSKVLKGVYPGQAVRMPVINN
jgi:N-acyl-D-glutamate deacylase